MRAGDIVFDIETKRSFDEVGGKDNLAKLGISVLGAFVYGDDKFIAFEEHELDKFEELLKKARRVIGFNIHHFDIPVLQPYISWNLKELPTLDLMTAVEQEMGFRLSLDNLCETSLGSKKSGHGMQAIYWYREGKIEEIKKYCLRDVELTRDLYEYGIKNGHILGLPRNSNGRVAIPVQWDKEHKNIRQVLREALGQKKSVEIIYGTGVAQTVDIYSIDGDSFDAYSHLQKTSKTFKIDLVLEAFITDLTYVLAKDVQGSIF
jgi:predicted PolB exonuclease-like 3'-5' exonuclease